jgi:transposase-like protein
MADAYPPEMRAAVLAALLAGQSVNAVATAYHLSRATVKAWRAAAGFAEHSATVSQEKGEDLGGLVTAYLQESLITLQAQAKHFRDPAWLGKQPAAELAVLHGVLADKTLRILTAIDTHTDDPALLDVAPPDEP